MFEQLLTLVRSGSDRIPIFLSIIVCLFTMGPPARLVVGYFDRISGRLHIVGDTRATQTSFHRWSNSRTGIFLSSRNREAALEGRGQVHYTSEETIIARRRVLLCANGLHTETSGEAKLCPES